MAKSVQLWKNRVELLATMIYGLARMPSPSILPSPQTTTVNLNEFPGSLSRTGQSRCSSRPPDFNLPGKSKRGENSSENALQRHGVRNTFGMLRAQHDRLKNIVWSNRLWFSPCLRASVVKLPFLDRQFFLLPRRRQDFGCSGQIQNQVLQNQSLAGRIAAQGKIGARDEPQGAGKLTARFVASGLADDVISGK